MAYKPREAHVIAILERAREHVRLVDYDVTARWVFYRLLQEGMLREKGDYKRLLGYLSKARKNFYGGWTPWTLTDESRKADVRGGGFDDGQSWVDALAERLSCSLDKWQSQEVYVELWFEAAAMEGQFRFHADPNIPLLAFHGDISIPEKWKAADRLADRWLELKKPIQVLYYGDLDPKGLQIPESAHQDVRNMMAQALWRKIYEERRWTSSRDNDEWRAEWREMDEAFTFTRIGLNDEHVGQYSIPENPERPGTWQWEGLEDDAAEELIGVANDYLDQDAFDGVSKREEWLTTQVRQHLSIMELEETEEEDDEETDDA